jgi:hypothetical protein
MNTKVYDVEVLKGPDELETGWSDPWAMGFGTAVVYDYQKDLYLFYGKGDRLKLVTDLAESIVVSFNGVRFDNNVILQPNVHRVSAPWQDYDILLEVVKSKFGVSTVTAAEAKVGAPEVHDGSIGLDGLAEGTLGLHKTGHGAKAPDLIREGKWSDVFAYNLNDVRLTRMLYDFIQKYGYLIDRKGNKIFIDKSV